MSSADAGDQPIQSRGDTAAAKHVQPVTGVVPGVAQTPRAAPPTMPMTSHDADPPVLYSRAEAIATLTLNRPARANVLSLEVVRTLHRALREIDESEAIKVVILAAHGEVFCAGQDLDELDGQPDASAKRALCLARNDVMLALAESAKVTIASIQGEVSGAGLELVAGCDLAIAAEQARFSAPGIDLGLWDHTAQVALSRAMPRRSALAMLLTGASFTAAEALRMNLLNEVVGATALAARTAALAHDIAAKSAHALSLGKYSYDHQATMDRAGAYEFVSDQFHRDVQSADAAEGMAALREGRPPRWQDR